MAVRAQRRRKKNSKHILAIITTLLVIIGAIMLFLYRDKLSDALSDTSGSGGEVFSDSEPFTYENGSRQLFGLVGDNLAISSSTGLQVLDSNGKTICRQVFSMTNPGLSSGEDFCAFYDVGGKSLRVLRNGDCTNLDTEYPIISVSAGSAGHLAVAEQESGYKGAVTVYDSSNAPVYKWYSGTGYVLDAMVSPDGASLAVLCVDGTGSVLHFFKLNSEEEYSSVSIPNELAFKLSYMKSGELCVLSENAIHFFSGSGKQLQFYSFGESYLAKYELSSEICAVVLNKYLSGSEVTLLSFSSDGNVLGTVSLTVEPVSLFAQKQKLLTLCTDEIFVFSRELRTLSQGRVVPGSKSAVLTPRGGIYLLSSHYAEKYDMQ